MEFDKLREYQQNSILKLRRGVLDGHNSQVLVAPTGSGKTVIAASILGEAHKKGKPAHFLCDRISLVDQTSKVLDFYGVPHGVIQGNHWRARPWEKIQVVSVATASRRKGKKKFIDQEHEEPKLVIWDECHASSSAGLEYCANPNVQVIGLTATPFSKWMGKSFTNIVNSITTNELIDEGFLVPLKYYAAKEADMSGVKAKFDGEWEDKGMEDRCLKIVGDVVEEWIGITHKYFGGPAKTICFSASVAHGEELCQQFQSRGYNFQQISYLDKDDESRREKIEEFRKPDSLIMGLISCEALTKGFDVPDIRIGIGARPYRKSLSGHLQQIGRVMRPHPGKEFGVWIDHSGNVLRFLDDMQTVFSEGVEDLSKADMDAKQRKEPTDEEKKKSKCHVCGFVHSVRICPACGAERPRQKSKVDNVAGSMSEVDVNGKKAVQHEWMADKSLVWKELCIIAGEMKKDYASAEKFALAQFKNIFGSWPSNRAPFEQSIASGVEPRKQVRGKVTANLIAYRHMVKKGIGR